MWLDEAMRVAAGFDESGARDFASDAAEKRRAAQAQSLLIDFAVAARPFVLQKIEGLVHAIECSGGTVFQRDNHRGFPSHVVQHH